MVGYRTMSVHSSLSTLDSLLTPTDWAFLQFLESSPRELDQAALLTAVKSQCDMHLLTVALAILVVLVFSTPLECDFHKAKPL